MMASDGVTAPVDPRLWEDVPRVVNDLSREIIGHAIAVHDELGPGLLERPYKMVLADRLVNAGHEVEVERPIPLRLGAGTATIAYRADIVVDGTVLVEVKSVEELTFAHIAQTKTYLRLGGYPLGVLLNFHAPKLYFGGIKRIVP